MKNRLFYLFAGICLLLGSCQHDEIASNGGNTATVRITAQVPATAIPSKTSRAAGDGSQINRCILEVYYAGQLYDRVTQPIANLNATFELRLVASQSYDLVFWADHVADATTEQGIATDLHYTTSSLKSISMQGDYDGNDETRDAFTASERLTVDGAFSKSVSLKRPFAQLNISTKDMASIQQPDYLPAYAQLSFTGIYTSFNALTGIASNEQPGAYTDAVALIDAATGALTTDYLFAPSAPEQKLTDMKLTFYNTRNEEIATNDRLTGIPLQRNLRTNVSGNLLTVGGHFDVIVDPGFSGDISKEIVEIATVAEVEQALAAGAENIRVTTPVKESATISVPAAYTPNTTLTLEIPAANNAELTISQAAAGDPSKEAPQSIVVNVPTLPNYAAYLTLDMPQSTVEINGMFYGVEASTADNTLIISANTIVSELVVKKGNVKVYGIIQDKLTKAAGYTGEVIHCVTSQQELDNALVDAIVRKIPYDYVLFEKPTKGLSGLDSEGNSAKLDKRLVFVADTELSGVDVTPVAGNAVMIASDDISVALNNMTITQNDASLTADRSSAILISGHNNVTMTVTDSRLIVPKANQRGVNIINATDPSSICTVTLDNTLIGPSATRLQTDYTTDSYTEEQRTQFKARTGTQGISIAAHAGKTVVNIRNNSVCEGMFYAVNVRQTGDAYAVNVDSSVLDGRAAFNTWGKDKGGTFNVTNGSKLVGRNYFPGPTEVFATIVVNQDSDNPWIPANNIITITDSEIHCFNEPQTNTNWQYAADMRSELANTLTLKGSTRIIDHSGRLPYAVQIAHPDAAVFTADPTVTLEGAAEGATLSGPATTPAPAK